MLHNKLLLNKPRWSKPPPNKLLQNKQPQNKLLPSKKLKGLQQKKLRD